ncbi:DUF86 domain-containing protein [Luteimicrobium sp. DT211]|uniref:HepT-like ribonuclease domain-containing protein n=1 Tax=Luteimicrobium sp. DT211 TaxID=3393412 RepID=UPI003CFB10F8
MSDDAKTARRLRDLEGFAAEAAHIVRQGEDAYRAPTPDGALLRNAGAHVLVKIATVVEKLPDSFKASYVTVDWRAITRMRNLVAHHYDKVNDDLMFQTLRVDVPRLIRDLGLGDGSAG